MAGEHYSAVEVELEVDQEGEVRLEYGRREGREVPGEESHEPRHPGGERYRCYQDRAHDGFTGHERITAKER